MFDVRAGAGVGGSAMQLRVACERIGAAAFVNVGGGSDAIIAASDDGCVTMFDSRRTDLPLSIVEVSPFCLESRCCRRRLASDGFVQVNDSVTCVASDGWSLLAGDSLGRLHVIEVCCCDAPNHFSFFILVLTRPWVLFIITVSLRLRGAALAHASTF